MTCSDYRPLARECPQPKSRSLLSPPPNPKTRKEILKGWRSQKVSTKRSSLKILRKMWKRARECLGQVGSHGEGSGMRGVIAEVQRQMRKRRSLLG